MGSERLQRIRRFRIVVTQQQVSDAIVQSIVQAALALEGVSFTFRTLLQQHLNEFEVAA